jgi:hypothetical protein
MMGKKKLRTIRAEVRQAFGMSDEELRQWFGRQLRKLEREPRAEPGEIASLMLLRDALLKEAPGSGPSRNPRRTGSKR